MHIPLFTVGLTLVIISLALSLTGEGFAFVLIAVSVLLIVLYGVLYMFLLHKRGHTIILLVCVSVVLACLLFIIKTETEYNPCRKLINEYSKSTCSISGRIERELSKDNFGKERCVVCVETITSKGESVPLPKKAPRVVLSANKIGATVGESILFTGKMKSGDFFKSSGWYICVNSYDDIEKKPFSYDVLPIVLRVDIFMKRCAQSVTKFTEGKLCRYLPDEYAYIVLGMLLSRKSGISKENIEVFKNAGIVHLLSVSGFHVTLWGMLIYRALLRLKCGKRLSSLGTIVFLFLFVLLTGFSKSAIRAGLMLSLFFVGRILTLSPDSKNSLGLAAIIILLLNPFAGGDVGFLLSFFATLGILTTQKPMMKPIKQRLKLVNDRKLRNSLEDLIGAFCVSLSALIYTMPVLTVSSSDISFCAPITNLLTTTAAPVIIFFSGVGVIISEVPVLSMLCYPIFLVTGLLTKYVLFIAKTVSSVPMGSLGTDEGTIKITVAACVLLVAFSIIMPRKPSSKITVLLCLIIFLGSLLSRYICI